MRLRLLSVAYPELVSGGVSKSHTFKGLVKVGASKGVIRVDLKKTWSGGGVSGQPENPPGYATDFCDSFPLVPLVVVGVYNTMFIHRRNESINHNGYIFSIMHS